MSFKLCYTGLLQIIILFAIFPYYTTCELVKTENESNLFQNRDLSPNDPDLLNYIRQHHLFPASNLPYQLKNFKRNPAVHKEAASKVFKKKKNGFFVEAGAHAGEWHSNTLELERNYGWTGLLMEPNPQLFLELLGKQRKAWASNTCLYSSSTPVQLKYIHHSKNAGNGKVLGLAGEHGPLLEIPLMQPDHFLQNKKSDVACFPLESTLLALNRTTIDYLSLDVVGNELFVLEHIPLEKLNVTYVSVAHFLRTDGAKKIKIYMNGRGYKHMDTSSREMYFKKK